MGFEKNDVPVLKFDFDFDKNPLSVLDPIPGEGDKRPRTMINGLLYNDSEEPALECFYAIFRTDSDLHSEKPIKLCRKLLKGQPQRIHKEYRQLDQMKNTDDPNRMVAGYNILLSCLVDIDKPCQFVMVLSCKNNYGKRFFTAYQITKETSQYNARSIYLGCAASPYELEVSDNVAKNIESLFREATNE